LPITFVYGGWLFANLMVVLPLAVLPSVILHELGHAAAATLLEFDVLRIRIGFGAVRFERRLFGYLWEVRSYLGDAATFSAPAARHHLKRRFLLVVAAGPVANLLVGTVALAVIATSYSED